MAKSYNRYRVRRGLNGVCILQRLISFPAVIGGRVDASIREFQWRDIPYSSAPSEFEISPYGKLEEEATNEKKPM